MALSSLFFYERGNVFSVSLYFMRLRQFLTRNPLFRQFYCKEEKYLCHRPTLMERRGFTGDRDDWARAMVWTQCPCSWGRTVSCEPDARAFCHSRNGVGQSPWGIRCSTCSQSYVLTVYSHFYFPCRPGRVPDGIHFYIPVVPSALCERVRHFTLSEALVCQYPF